MHTLLFFEPGHFHAALVLRQGQPNVAATIHVYAAPGNERDAFLGLVEGFNTRPDDPTAWRPVLHQGPDPLADLIAERAGDVVVLAGRNAGRLAVMRRLHEAGFHILADKPWLTGSAALDDLAAVTADPPAALDFMTSRHDPLARLRQRIIADPALFGEFVAGATPALEIASVHHLMKRVDGRPLRRPPWFYDIDVQGDGIVDLHSHMIDQAQWLIAPDRTFALDRDVADLKARRWTTHVPLAAFRDSTGASEFPAALADRVGGDGLRLACNGEIAYRLCAVPVRQRAEWRLSEPDGGGDIVSLDARGSRADVIARLGPETGFASELHIAPHAPAPLDERLAAWQAEFPGVSARPSSFGFEIVLPADRRLGHEQHFPLLLADFLGLVEAGRYPKPLRARIAMRYGLLARAHDEAVDD